MKYNKIVSAFFATSLLWIGCTEAPEPEYTAPVQAGNQTPDRTAFALGADISWATQMESEGETFYNADGQEMECTALMKEIGMNAVRFRVWVNPEAGWSSKSDVIVKALRAHKLGMRIMIDFHYSDTWADPTHQAVPEAWASYDIDQLKTAMAEHTTDVLTALKDRGIDVEWVQVGNETRLGMMWPLGYTVDNAANYAALTTTGYDAVKSVYPDAKVIVHIDSGNNINIFYNIFNILDNNGGKYDMIGMSLYPWDSETSTWQTPTDACISNITTLAERYEVPVMICEVGMPVSEPDKAYEMLTYLISGAKASGHCDGVFYWEPEAPAGYNDGYQLGAFAKGMPTHALDAFTEAAE